MLNIVELLSLRGLDLNKKIKMVRHQDKRYDMNKIYHANQINIYQSYQAKPVFKDCDYIVSFIGEERTKARFIGVYKVGLQSPAIEHPVPDNLIYDDCLTGSDYFYELTELDNFTDYKDRLIIDWGKSAISWHQWLTEKEVIEIRPKGYVKYFPGFLDFIISFGELKDICDNPDANKEWHVMLKSVAGIYLIADKNTGQQYVGSAYGENGILGRWIEYSKTGHGNNEMLKQLFVDNPLYSNNFNFSILQTLPKTLTNKEVLKYETLYKGKLGTRSFGLNLN